MFWIRELLRFLRYRTAKSGSDSAIQGSCKEFRIQNPPFFLWIAIPEFYLFVMNKIFFENLLPTVTMGILIRRIMFRIRSCAFFSRIFTVAFILFLAPAHAEVSKPVGHSLTLTWPNITKDPYMWKKKKPASSDFTHDLNIK